MHYSGKSLWLIPIDAPIDSFSTAIQFEASVMYLQGPAGQ